MPISQQKCLILDFMVLTNGGQPKRRCAPTGTPALFLICFCTVRVTPKMTESVNDLLKKLTDAQEATQRQLTELQQQVTSSRATSMKLVVQKIEEERGYTFRKKGHEKQWRFNKAVDSHMDNALDELKKIPRSSDEKTTKIMDNVQEELEKGREEIADRQKKIKMADRSEYSWGMVEASCLCLLL